MVFIFMVEFSIFSEKMAAARSIDSILSEHLPEAELRQVNRQLYGQEKPM